MPGETYDLALVFLLLRLRRRTRFFLHLALILSAWAGGMRSAVARISQPLCGGAKGVGSAQRSLRHSQLSTATPLRSFVGNLQGFRDECRWVEERKSEGQLRGLCACAELPRLRRASMTKAWRLGRPHHAAPRQRRTQQPSSTRRVI